MQKSKLFFEVLAVGSTLLIGFVGCGQQVTSEVTPSGETLTESSQTIVSS
ncbi:MAG: hypothetical protein HY590_03020, partial [Candidatus Omnitrophica bacterium]|nr:hypothetical protein [Candidatus Omnitrophota bacterium]